MKTCQFKNQVIDYLYNELSIDKYKEFEKHLSVCTDCLTQLTSFVKTKQLIDRRIRPKPTREFLNLYHQNLKRLYITENRMKKWINRLIQSLFYKPSLVVRSVEIAFVLMLGILIGRNLNPKRVTHPDHHINNSQVYSLNDFIFKTELLLLEIVNTHADQEIASVFTEQNCKTLLQKTAVLKQRAIYQNDQRLLSLLNRLEIILLELSNLDSNSSRKELDDLIQTIKEYHVFVELKQFDRFAEL